MPLYRLSVKIDAPALGGDGANVWHIRTGGGLNEDGAANTAIGWLEDFYNLIAPLTPTTCSFSFEGTAVEIAVEEPTMLEGLDTWTTSGTSANDYLPPANCIVVGWRTSLATRSGRGRTFLGPFANNVSDATGTPSSGALSTIRGAADALVSASTGADPEGVAVAVWSPTDNLARDITGASVRDQFAVLRSRRD